MKQKDKGIGLVEVLIAGVVLIFVIISVATIFPSLFLSNQKFKTVSSAEGIASEELELITSLKYTDILPSPSPSPLPNPLINTINYTYDYDKDIGSKVVLVDTRSSAFPKPIYKYPKKLSIKKLNSNGEIIGEEFYRVDLLVKEGKHDQIVRSEENEKLASINYDFTKLLMKFIVAPVYAAGVSFTVAPTSGYKSTTDFTFTANCSGCGSPVTYKWNFGVDEGPDQTTQNPTINHIYLCPSEPEGSTSCTRTATLSASWVKANGSTVTVVATPKNITLQISSVSFTVSPTSGTIDDTYTFTATAQNAGSNSIYNWNFGDSTTGTGSTITHKYSQPNNYTVYLTVIGGSNPTATQTVEVRPTSKSINIDSINPTSPKPNESISFQARTTGLTYPVTYTWDFGDGTTITDIKANHGDEPSQVTHTYTTAGNYNIKVTATDNSNPVNTLETTNTIHVQPLITITASPGVVVVMSGGSATVNFSASCNGCTSPSYKWNFGDGTTGSGNNTSHTYTTAGTYSVTATSNEGSSTSIQVVITESSGSTATGGGQSNMKKIVVIVSKWSETPPTQHLASITTLKAKNDY